VGSLFLPKIARAFRPKLHGLRRVLGIVLRVICRAFVFRRERLHHHLDRILRTGGAKSGDASRKTAAMRKPCAISEAAATASRRPEGRGAKAPRVSRGSEIPPPTFVALPRLANATFIP
jgi:hypothetical protein